MPPIEAIGSIGTSLAAKVQLANQAARLAHLERNRVVVSPATFNLPNLGRVGDRETIIVQVRDRAGALNNLTAEFEKVRADIVRVNIAAESLSRSGAVTFDIHFYENGSISGYDTDGSGRVNSVVAPGVLFNDSGVNVRLSFNDTRLGSLDFSTISIPAQYLELLQGVGGAYFGNDTTISSAGSTIEGTSGDDVLTGTAANNTINGGDGNDTISGAPGADTLNGGADNDTIYGDAGDDTINGDAGNDTLIGGTGDDAINGGTGTDTVDYSSDGAAVAVNLESQTATDGSGGSDTLDSIENATGSDFDDQLTGSTGDNVLVGGAGNDTIDDGGGGTDTLTGDAGNDTFVIYDASGSGTITDFTIGSDVIDLSAVSAIGNFGQLQAAATDDGSGNTVIDLGTGSTLTLTGITEADLNNSDFLF